MNISIRPYRGSDLVHLISIYRDAIQQQGATHYSLEQIRAWSSFADDTTTFREWVDSTRTLVAIEPGLEPIGFTGLEANGRVASLFVHPGFMRRGIATRLLESLICEAQLAGLDRLTTDASEFSRPVFTRFGFTTLEIEVTRFKGVSFNRYVMERGL